MPRTGRRPGEPETQARIAEVARELFAKRGFQGTSIRAIAAGAQVDPALVLHYYGTKQALFVAVTELPVDQWTVATELSEVEPDRIGERLVRFALSLWEEPPTRSRMLGILRSAVTDPRAAAMLRNLFSRQGPVVVIRSFAPSEPELRTELIAAQIVGLVMARYVLRVEPLASASVDELVRIVGPTIQRYATGELVDDGRSRRSARRRS